MDRTVANGTSGQRRRHARDVGEVHLLVVDDDQRMLRLCGRHLEDANLVVPGISVVLHLFGSGAEAIDRARQIVGSGHGIACALVDFLLGADIDGIDVTKGLWEIDPRVECTLMTGAGDLVEPEIVPRIPPASLDRWDFLAKPFTRLEVSQRVRRSLLSWVAHRRADLRGAENERLVARLARSKETLQRMVMARTRALSDRNSALEQKTAELEKAMRELEMAHAMLVQQEKMASIGVLAAGVAHELNNPIGFVNSNLATLGRYCDKLVRILDAYERRLPGDPELEALRRGEKLSFVLEDLPVLVRESLEGTERVRKIVADLKTFSHPAERQPVHADLNEGLASTLNIVHNELKYKARVVTDFGAIPQVRCRPGEVNQVFMNLLVNACQAIPGQGEIRVTTRADGDSVVVSIADTGCGIPEEIRNRVFDPFFTTKPVGQGTGLGLTISYDIIRKHGGSITFETEMGKGTTFHVRLPVAGEEPA
ncbi:MAG: ATP-binding protein [Planctomycetes bacterium]|nr:ATP-binding protein [Planctomycetota bacterium]